MAKTVVGLYDNIAEAQHVVQELIDFGIPAEDISLVAGDGRGEYKAYLDRDDSEEVDGIAEGAGIGAAVGGLGGLLLGLGVLAIPGVGPLLAAGPLAAALVGAGVGGVAGGMIGALVGVGVPEDEAEYYAEGVRRGGALVTVHTVDELTADVTAIMDRYHAIDIRERAESWRASGWTGYDADHDGYADDTSAAIITDAQTTDTATHTHAEDGEVRVPVVEEEIQVGKRAVEQGSARVRTRVTEQPVEETVSLRREHVSVDRRPADRPVTDADAEAFKEETIEVTATSEEPVVRKQARVTEEVVISKDVEHETQTVRDTVRRKDVEVEHDGGAGMAADGFDSYQPAFRTHYDAAFGTTGRSFDDYLPAYRYGYDLAHTGQYNGRGWREIEADIRRDWQARYPDDAWADFKAAVRRGWETVTGRR